ncbi:MAG: DUF6159 family protein [Thermoplasmata archaeon]
MGRISTGWNLTKVSLRVLRQDKELLLFPLLSGISLILILAGFVGGMFLAVGFEGMFQGSFAWISIVVLFVYYVVAFFVGLFFNAAVIGAAMIRLNGGHPTLSDGLRIARENVGRIFLWALFAATVAMIIRMIQERVGIVGKIIMGLVGVAWTVATFFVVPVLIYEKLGPWAAVKRSASIFTKTWGETFTGQFTMGGIFVLAGLLGILPIVLGLAAGGVVGVVIGGVVAFVYWVILGIVASAANSILVAALYRYATTGKVAEDFQGLPMFGALTRQTYGQVP